MEEYEIKGSSMIGLLLVVTGLIAIVLAGFTWRPKKELWSLVATTTLLAIGIYYVFSGLPKLNDPPSQLELKDVFGLIGGAFGIGKAFIWLVTRTDFYVKLMNALTSIPEIKGSVSRIEVEVKAKVKS